MVTSRVYKAVSPRPPPVSGLFSVPLQILVYEGEMERAQGQLEAEMQTLEEEKNRVIEEAFIRAESEMKAVHENLAGGSCPWSTCRVPPRCVPPCVQPQLTVCVVVFQECG